MAIKSPIVSAKSPERAALANESKADAYESFWVSVERELVKVVPQTGQSGSQPAPGEAYQAFLDPGC